MSSSSSTTGMIHRTPAAANGRQRQQRNNGNGSLSTTCLPLHHHHQHATSSSPSAGATTATATTKPHHVSSSSFLMGGSYYPGKDKQQPRFMNHRKRRVRHAAGAAGSSRLISQQHPIAIRIRLTLQRLQESWKYTSRPKRILLVVVVTFFVLLVFVLSCRSSWSFRATIIRRQQQQHWAERLPIVRSIVKGRHAWWWKRDILVQLERNEREALMLTETDTEDTASSVVVPAAYTTTIELATRKQSKAMAEELQLERQRLDQKHQQQQPNNNNHQHYKSNRIELLEKIVPAWYHRNDKVRNEEEMTVEVIRNEKQEHNNAPQPTTSNIKNPQKSQNNDHPPPRNQPPIDQQQRRQQQERNLDTAHRQQQGQQQGHPVPATTTLAPKRVLAGTDNITTAVINTSSSSTSSQTTTTRKTATTKKHKSSRDEVFSSSTRNKKAAPSSSSSSRPMLRTLQNMDWENVTAHSRCPANLDDSNVQITLVTQSSLDRAWILDETCTTRWTDPIIAVIALHPHEMNKPDNEVTNISVWTSGWQMKCPHLTILPYRLTLEESTAPAMYPVNHLRNLGLDAVQTSHVLVVDVDFVPSRDLAQNIREALLLRRQVRRQHTATATASTTTAAANATVHDTDATPVHELDYNPEHFDALVVPAFERILDVPCTTVDDCKRHLRSNHSFIPNTFDELRTCVRGGHCQVFQSDNNWEGHYSTKTQRWLAKDWYETTTTESISSTTSTTTNATNVNNTTTAIVHDVKSIPCFDSLRYEPYVVIRWCRSAISSSSSTTTTTSDNATVSHSQKQQQQQLLQQLHRLPPVAPYYDERFHGYGKNKIEYIAHLRLAWYQFAILPKGFIVHNPHVESKSKQAWNNVTDSSNQHLHMDMDLLYPVFLKELIYKYHARQHDGNISTKTNDMEEQERRGQLSQQHPEHIVDSCQYQE